MSLIGILILIAIAGICGAIAQVLAGFSRTGCLTSVLLGFMGALTGRWLAVHIHLPDPFTLHIGGAQFPILWSIIGAALFAAAIGLLTGRR